MASLLHRILNPNLPAPELPRIMSAGFAALAAADMAARELKGKKAAPTAPQAASRRARPFRRSADAAMRGRTLAPGRPERLTATGATRHYNRMAAVPQTPTGRMASALLMARANGYAHPVSALDIVRLRAQGMQVVGNAHNRIQGNFADAANGPIDTPRMLGAQARFAYLPQAQRLRM